MKIITIVSAILLWNFVIRNPAKAFAAAHCGDAHHIQKRKVDLEKIWSDIKRVWPGGDKYVKIKDIETGIKKVIKKFLDEVLESYDAEMALSETEKAKEQFITLAEQYFKPERIIKDIEDKKKLFMDIAGKLLNSDTIMKQLEKKKS